MGGQTKAVIAINDANNPALGPGRRSALLPGFYRNIEIRPITGIPPLYRE